VLSFVFTVALGSLLLSALTVLGWLLLAQFSRRSHSIHAGQLSLPEIDFTYRR
jgi:hypothetical protein